MSLNAFVYTLCIYKMAVIFLESLFSNVLYREVKIAYNKLTSITLIGSQAAF